MPETLSNLLQIWLYATEHHPCLSLIFWLLFWIYLIFSASE